MAPRRPRRGRSSACLVYATPASSTELITFPRARVSCRSGGRRNTVGKAPLTIPNETIRLAEIASYISDSVQETGIDGLARTNLRFSSQGGP